MMLGKLGFPAAVVVLTVTIAACGQRPIKPAETHLRAEEPPPAGAIPPPVQMHVPVPAGQPGAACGRPSTDVHANIPRCNVLGPAPRTTGPDRVSDIA